MAEPTRTPTAPREWLALGEASRLLGVNPVTLRRWADQGRVEASVTAGGHRRFRRESIEALLTARKPDPYPRERLSEAADAIAGDLHRRIRREEGPARPWQTGLTTAQRTEFRELGQETFNLVIQYVAATKRPERGQLLREAQKTGASYGATASRAGLSLAEAVEAFLFFRSPVLDAIQRHLRRRSADPRTVAAVFREASAAVDEVLVSLVASYRDEAPEPKAEDVTVIRANVQHERS